MFVIKYLGPFCNLVLGFFGLFKPKNIVFVCKEYTSDIEKGDF